MGSRMKMLHANDLLKLIPPETVSCCITSPPFWRLPDRRAKRHKRRAPEGGQKHRGRNAKNRSNKHRSGRTTKTVE